MNKAELLLSIAKYLSRFVEQIKITNSSDNFSLNKISEDILIELLNKALKLNLVNANFSEKGNYPAIDLIDKDQKVGIQVTATNDLTKIKKSIDKFYTHNIYEQVDKLLVYILTEKKPTYPQAIINNYIDKVITKVINNKSLVKLSFDVNKNILDKRDLYKSYDRINDITILNELNQYLKVHFDDLVAKASLSKHLEYLKDQFYEVVFEDTEGMTLKDIYVDPSYAIYESCLLDKTNFERTHTYGFLKSKQTSSLNSLLLNFVSNIVDTSLNTKKSRMLLLLGYPGQGKTSSLKKFLNEYILQENSNRKNIFYYKLKNIRQGRLLIDSPLTLLYDEACNDTEVNISKIEFRKSILLLDGLDELFMKENMSLDDIEKICKEISREVDRYTNLTVIVTSRYGYVDLKRIQKENCFIVQLDLFSLKQQLEWLQKFKAFHPDSLLTEEEIKRLHSKNNYEYMYLRELISQPILLQIIATLNQKIDIKENRSTIYQKLFNEIINRKYSPEGKLENLQDITKEDLRNLIQEIAFQINKSGNGFITQRELISNPVVTQYLSKFPNKDFKNNIKGVLISFYFTEHKYTEENTNEEVAIEFLHRSLQEYMTAEKVNQSMFQLFLDTSSRSGTYIISDENKILELLNELFAFQNYSFEIYDYMYGLLIVFDKNSKLLLSQRLSSFLKQLCEKGFLLKYEQNERYPIQKSLRTFVGYWFYLLNCNSTVNYLDNSKVRDEVVNLLTLSYNCREVEAPLRIYDNQNFSDSTLQFYQISEASMINVLIERSTLTKIELFDTTLINTSFQSSDIFGVSLFECSLKNVTFQNCEIYELEFLNCELENVSFKNAFISSIKFENCNFKKQKSSHFNGITFNHESLKSFIKYSFEVDLTTCFLHDGETEYKTVSLTEELISKIIKADE